MARKELTTKEKQFLAIAIQGLCVRQGASIYFVAIDVAKKLELEKELESSLKSWIDYSQRHHHPQN